MNTRRDSSSELKRRPDFVSLGQGKWPNDFIDASEPRARSRKANTIKPSTCRATSKEVFLHRPPSGSVESPSHLRPRRPVHRLRHSLDAPVLLPKEAVYGGRGQGVGPDVPVFDPGVQILHNGSTNRRGMSLFLLASICIYKF